MKCAFYFLLIIPTLVYSMEQKIERKEANQYRSDIESQIEKPSKKVPITDSQIIYGTKYGTINGYSTLVKAFLYVPAVLMGAFAIGQTIVAVTTDDDVTRILAILTASSSGLSSAGYTGLAYSICRATSDNEDEFD